MTNDLIDDMPEETIMPEEDPSLEKFSQCYTEMCNKVIQAIFEVSVGNPALAYALSANAEARFRAANHFNLTTALLNAGKGEPKDKP